VLDQQPGDPPVVDRLEQHLSIVGHDDLLVRREHVEHRVIAKRPVDVEQEVVGVDEEVAAARPLPVIESRNRREQQRAGSDRAVRVTHDDAEPIPLAEPRQDVVDTRRLTVEDDGE
jgi:hypothetical protein